MSIAYNTGIPAAANNPSVDQPNMLTNTNSINAIWNVDHITFNNDSGVASGAHKKMSLLTQGTDPALLSGCNSVIYSKIPTIPSTGPFEQPFFKVAAGVSQIATITGNPPGGAPSSWTYLPGGMIFQWGFYNAGPGGVAGTGSVTFPTPFLVANAYSVTITLIDKAAGTNSIHPIYVRSGTVSTTGFTWDTDSSTTAVTGFYWMAIGN